MKKMVAYLVDTKFVGKMDKWDELFINVAILMANMSKSNRLKVGAVAVKDNHLLVSAFNGTVAKYGEDSLEDEFGATTPDTIHAEENILCQAAVHGISLKGATLYCTHNCCRHCSALLAQAGIVEVKYLNEYRDLSGIEKLKNYNVKVTKL